MKTHFRITFHTFFSGFWTFLDKTFSFEKYLLLNAKRIAFIKKYSGFAILSLFFWTQSRNWRNLIISFVENGRVKMIEKQMIENRFGGLNHVYFGNYLVPEMTNNRKAKDERRFASETSTEWPQANMPAHIVPKRTKLIQ